MYKLIQLKNTTIEKLDKLIKEINEGEITPLIPIDYDDAINILFDYREGHYDETEYDNEGLI